MISNHHVKSGPNCTNSKAMRVVLLTCGLWWGRQLMNARQRLERASEAV